MELIGQRFKFAKSDSGDVAGDDGGNGNGCGGCFFGYRSRSRLGRRGGRDLEFFLAAESGLVLDLAASAVSGERTSPAAARVE